jgi:hypothetical protein
MGIGSETSFSQLSVPLLPCSHLSLMGSLSHCSSYKFPSLCLIPLGKPPLGIDKDWTYATPTLGDSLTIPVPTLSCWLSFCVYLRHI